MDPGQILGISSGYWRSLALQAAVKLDLFTVVGDGAALGSEIAEAIGGDGRGVSTLLDAVAALGLIEKQDGRYRNTEAARDRNESWHERSAVSSTAAGAARRFSPDRLGSLGDPDEVSHLSDSPARSRAVRDFAVSSRPVCPNALFGQTAVGPGRG